MDGAFSAAINVLQGWGCPALLWGEWPCCSKWQSICFFSSLVIVYKKKWSALPVSQGQTASKYLNRPEHATPNCSQRCMIRDSGGSGSIENAGRWHCPLCCKGVCYTSRFLLFFCGYQPDLALKQQRSSATYSISSPHHFGKGKVIVIMVILPYSKVGDPEDCVAIVLYSCALLGVELLAAVQLQLKKLFSLSVIQNSTHEWLYLFIYIFQLGQGETVLVLTRGAIVWAFLW